MGKNPTNLAKEKRKRKVFEMKYIIQVKTLTEEILIFHTNHYLRLDGHIAFIDKFGKEKSFPANNTNIQEVKE